MVKYFVENCTIRHRYKPENGEFCVPLYTKVGYSRLIIQLTKRSPLTINLSTVNIQWKMIKLPNGNVYLLWTNIKILIVKVILTSIFWLGIKHDSEAIIQIQFLELIIRAVITDELFGWTRFYCSITSSIVQKSPNIMKTEAREILKRLKYLNTLTTTWILSILPW